MEIDLGAIVKGYFADQLQQYFLAHGVSSGIIDLGGNVLTIGRQPETLEKWHVVYVIHFIRIHYHSLH